MRIKADWTEYLHGLRSHQMEIVFKDCRDKAFGRSLELGSGDGFVSNILIKYCRELICTDLNPRRLEQEDKEGITYKILDAEKVGDEFEGGEFEFVFSSSMLEHLPNYAQAIEGVFKVLSDDGIAIHIVPNRVWKAVTVLAYWPNKIAVLIDKILAGELVGKKRREKKKKKKTFGGNNLKIESRKQPFFSKLFFPRLHGISNNTFQEFVTFGEKNWAKRFEEAGFEIVAIKGDGFCSGYGFGFNRLRALLEKIGLNSESVFILCKPGHKDRYGKYFQEGQG